MAPPAFRHHRLRALCSLDDLGASGEQAGSRASERVVAEAVYSVGGGEWHAQAAAAARELHGLGRERRGGLCWNGSEPGRCTRPRLGPHQKPGHPAA